MKPDSTFYFLVILIIFSLLTGCSERLPGEYDSLAKCLTDNGAKMYGTEWCSHCKNQKKEFGSSFEYINYVDCDFQMSECENAGVKGYPTWVINGENYPGEQPLSKLAYTAGCEFKSETV